MSKRKLLLADDSITIQKVVNLTFADEGIEVIAVGDGDSAMLKINESLPDLILADVNMPGLSGYEICEQIKQNAETKDIPVILLVGSFEPFDEARAESIGANDYLTKPFQSIRQLVNKVTELLEAKAQASEPAPVETEDNSWQYADTKEMPQEELHSANLGDAAMDDEMIDAEHFGADSEPEVEPQDAKTEELPRSFVENIEETRENEEVIYAPVDETPETETTEISESEESKEEVKETAFEIVSNEDTEDEFEKALPTLDEPEQTEESVTYSENDHFSDEAEEPRYAETAEDSEFTPHETPETSETVYEFAETERDLDSKVEEISEANETDETPQESVETSAETEVSENTDSPIYEIADETSEADETFSSETENVEDSESETVAETSEETEASPVSEVSEESTEEVEESKDETVSETLQESAEPENLAETEDSPEPQETETAETEEIEPVKEEVTESKASAMFDMDENLLELPPLVKTAPVAATSPQVAFVSETTQEVKEEVAEPTTETTESTAEVVEPVTETETAKVSEPTTESIIKEQIVEATGSTNITPEMIEAIAQKVAEKLSDRAIREIAWEVVPQMTELIIKKMAEENESKK